MFRISVVRTAHQPLVVDHSSRSIVAWATRTLIVRHLKGLQDIIGALHILPIRPFTHDDNRKLGITIVSPRGTPNGWAFGDVDPFPGTDLDHINGAKYLKDLYLKVQPDYAGR